ncbi:hypothetical protein EYU43_08155 [Campylobacter upsaliensis]|nr:hypothetical protein [Campylobacter upsaliensis]EAI2045638.1 hypothetical protein [Campylobacter upsaliensis]EAI2445699.1 hypothetical protein [Campylobacter upsaliensis]
MSNRMENYPNIEKLQMALNELAFHQVHQAWIDKKIPQYSLIILERWAELYPNTIKNLGMSELMALALPQAQMELQILESKEAEEMREQGLTDMEILTQTQINLNQFIAIEPQIYSPLFQEMMMRDKEQMQEETINNQYWNLQQEMMTLKEEVSNLGKN